MRVFVDTPALLAVLDRDDENHFGAAYAWERLLERRVRLLTTDYVLHETGLLARRYLGPEAVRTLYSDIVPVLEVLWVDEVLHRAAVEAFLASHHKNASLVDHVSFAAMRQQGISVVFSPDPRFEKEGFQRVP